MSNIHLACYRLSDIGLHHITSHHIALPLDTLDTLGHCPQSSIEAFLVIQHLVHRQYSFSLAPWLSSVLFDIMLHMVTLPLDTSYLAFPLHHIVPCISLKPSFDIPPYSL
jgi:uncharacterized protein (DUF2342 family)